MSAPQANPWLGIPATDYEAHMSSPAVGQLRYLGALFADLLATHQPRDLAVLGCATGNGFEFIAPETRTVIGLDINAEYLAIARDRHAGRLPGLRLICADFRDYAAPPRSLDLIHAALFLEYVDPDLVAAAAAQWLRPGAVLSVVLQLPVEVAGPVTPTPYASLAALAPHMRLVDAQAWRALADRHGFAERAGRIDRLPTGKEFFAGVYTLRDGTPAPPQPAASPPAGGSP